MPVAVQVLAKMPINDYAEHYLAVLHAADPGCPLEELVIVGDSVYRRYRQQYAGWVQAINNREADYTEEDAGAWRQRFDDWSAATKVLLEKVSGVDSFAANHQVDRDIEILQQDLAQAEQFLTPSSSLEGWIDSVAKRLEQTQAFPPSVSAYDAACSDRIQSDS
ncbi:MAG: hypothetical protein AAF790_05675 [Planctomycetota bacterium]